jgi:phosphoribosylaminoimidazole-succinocarboxamide synthase
MTGGVAVERGAKLYEGKAKVIYATADPQVVWMEFKDEATAFNGQKRGTIAGKGAVNARITGLVFEKLAAAGIPNHLVQQLSERVLLTRRVQIIPLEVVVRNIAAGSLTKRLGLAEGTKLPAPVLEFYYKNDDLGDPLVNDSHIAVLQLAMPEQLQALRAYSRRINEILVPYFAAAGLELVDCKLEFGTADGEIMLADEISPDTCRFWDLTTGEKLDKDRFRRDLGNVAEAYQEVLMRLERGTAL